MKGLLDTQMEMSSSSGCVSLEGRGEVHEEVVGVEKAETGCSHPEGWGSLERTCFASLAFKDLDRLLTDPSDLTPRPPPAPKSQSVQYFYQLLLYFPISATHP